LGLVQDTINRDEYAELQFASQVRTEAGVISTLRANAEYNAQHAQQGEVQQQQTSGRPAGQEFRDP